MEKKFSCDEKTAKAGKKERFSWVISWIFPLAGLAALIWFLIRVIPKPSRASYPCQRLAFPIASSFVIWLTGIVGSVLAFRKAEALLKRKRAIGAVSLLLLAVLALWLPMSLNGKWALALDDFVGSEGSNAPMGEAKGIYPGRVVWVHNLGATSWEGPGATTTSMSTSDEGVIGITSATSPVDPADPADPTLWWHSENVSQYTTSKMLSQTVQWLTGERTDEAAWDAIFKYHNLKKHDTNVGYQIGEKIVIKSNLRSDIDWPADGAGTTTPQAIYALMEQLIYKAGVKGQDITLYDASQLIGMPIYNRIKANPDPEFQAIKFVIHPMYDTEAVPDDQIGAIYDTSNPIHFADPTVPDNGATYPPTRVTEANYMINFASFRGHSLAGVTLCAKNHFGSIYTPSQIDRWSKGWTPANLHEYVDRANAMGAYSSFVEIMGFEHFGGKTILYLIDGLYAFPSQYESRIRYASFNNDWTNSMFASLDNVAIESVCTDFLADEQRKNPEMVQVVGNVDNYLHEASQAENPPSGSFYDPEGDGSRLDSLGVHEHWNNATEKKYSRNLNNGNGIELVYRRPALRADVDESYTVDTVDMALIADRWLENNCDDSNDWCGFADVSRDGVVNLKDIQALSESWDAIDLEEGLIAHYKLDEVSGSVVHDETGNHNALIMTPAGVTDPTWTVQGAVDGAIDFADILPNPSGAGSVIVCPNTNDEFNVGWHVTVAFWVKFPSNFDTSAWENQWNDLATFTGSTGDFTSYRFMHRMNGQLRWDLKIDPTEGSSDFGYYITSGTAGTAGYADVLDGNWHHVAGTYDGSEAILYIDGVPQVDVNGKDGLVTGPLLNVDTNFTIGGSGYVGHREFPGAIDDVRVYKRELPPQEIIRLANVTGDNWTPPDPSPQSAYGGTNRTIPGQIEAEDYDEGGQDVAYYDTSAGNTGNDYRNDDVDVEARDGGYNVGWTINGEWLEYTVDATAGTYDMVFRLASTYSGKQIRVLLDGTELGIVNVPNTGDWGVFQEVTISNVTVPAGTDKILRVEFIGGNTNFNWFKFQ